jgi:hypothetical protein
MDRLGVLWGNFQRGCQFFNNEMLFGGMSPYLKRKAAEFEREVIAPFDAACKKATPEELRAAGVFS